MADLPLQGEQPRCQAMMSSLLVRQTHSLLLLHITDATCTSGTEQALSHIKQVFSLVHTCRLSTPWQLAAAAIGIVKCALDADSDH